MAGCLLKEFVLLKILKHIYTYPMQTTNPDDMNFHEQTDTFNLTVTLSDNKLIITLKDFVDWVIYSK